MVWTSASIYYLSLRAETSSLSIAENSKPLNQTQASLADSNNLNTIATNKEIEGNQRNDSDTLTTLLIEEEDVGFVIREVTNGSDEADQAFLLDEIKKSINLDEAEKDDHIIKTETLYPKYQKADLILDKKLVNYATELRSYLTEHPDKKVTIIGHTDNVGNAGDNYRNGLRKSRQIKWYMTVRKGIPRSKISAISKGETEPIGNNKTSRGRKLNNRIEFIVD